MNVDKNMTDFEDEPPRKNFWSLFKVSSYERLVEMQKGILYMNSLDYFSSLKDEESLALRVDELEKVYGVLRAGKNSTGHATLSIDMGNGKELDLGPESILTANFARPKNIMLFCMGAFADGQNGLIPGENSDTIVFDKKFLEFGSHLLLIINPGEFSKRINRAIKKDEGIFNSKYFHDGYGLVNYKPLNEYSGPIGLFTKDLRYSWQMEFRLTFGVENECLNNNGAYELNVGDISDISHIVPVQGLIDEPLKVKRRAFKKVAGAYEEVSG